jgi:hypothetical protein
VFPVRYGQTYGVELKIKDRTMDNVQTFDCYISGLSLRQEKKFHAHTIQ